MSEVSLVPAGRDRSVLTGIDIGTPPPARIYISGHTYKIAAPTSVLPPIVNVAKAIANWVGPAGRIAKNVFYILKGAGSGSTSDPAWLTLLADSLMNSWGVSNVNSQVSTSWTLQSITCKDAGGTSAQSTSSVAPIPGTAGSTALPPQVAVVISWKIAEVYRGGKPRWYLPGIPTSAVFPSASSQVEPVYASSLDTAATLLKTTINSSTPGATAITLGTVSYFSGHVVRPTPGFRAFFDVKIHERLDSQRRRSGPESLFPSTP